MLWLAVLILPDGSRVESGVLSVEAAGPDLTARRYRLLRADGSVIEFSTLTSILRHLCDHYDPDDLRRATSGREALALTLAANRHTEDAGLALPSRIDIGSPLS